MKTFLPFSLSARSRRVLSLTLALAAPLAAVHLTGCGGGGGGSSSGISIPLPKVNVSFQLFFANGDPATTGTVTLRQNGVDVFPSMDVGTTSQVRFTGVQAGTYQVIFQDLQGVTTRVNVVVQGTGNQTFQITSGQDATAPSLGLTISGIIRLNPTTSNVAACTDTTTPVTARLLIRVRDANQPDRPIVAQIEKPDQTTSSATQAGRFQVPNIPGPGTYIVEAVTARATATDPVPFQVTGRSPIFTIEDSSTPVAGLRICANAGTFAPGDVPDTTTAP
jgi:hypothetical protein